jgi:hypothetical protein
MNDDIRKEATASLAALLTDEGGQLTRANLADIWVSVYGPAILKLLQATNVA